MTQHIHKLRGLPPAERAPATPAGNSLHVRATLHAAALTLALSLPQGLLALPIAVAQVGMLRGLAVLLLAGALNTITMVWAARACAAFFARHGVIPSLPQLARDRLGVWGGVLARLGGATLFFLALLASVTGLARSMAALTGAPAAICGACCAVVLLIFVLLQAALGTRLLVGLGLLNIGLLVALLLLLLPHVRHTAVAPTEASALPAMAGVSLMLFFAPMLLPAVAGHVLPRGCHPRTLVRGSAAGVASGAVLLGVWAVVVCGAAGAAALAGASGTVLPALGRAVPVASLPATLLGLLLLGMTALRCAAVLAALADELAPPVLGGMARHMFTQLPVAACLTIALALLLGGSTSYTQLVAVAGIGGASLTSMVVPALIAWSGARRSRLTRKPGHPGWPQPPQHESQTT